MAKKGIGKAGMRYLFDTLNGKMPQNEVLADMVFEQVSKLSFMNK